MAVAETSQLPCCGAHPPLFVCLLTDKRYVNNPKMHTTIAWIGVTSNPFCYLARQNRDPRFIPGDQLTREGAPNYQIELVCGPFFPAQPGAPRAHVMAEECKKGSRKLNRIPYFATYAESIRKFGPQLYARDPKLVEKYFTSSK